MPLGPVLFTKDWCCSERYWDSIRHLEVSALGSVLAIFQISGSCGLWQGFEAAGSRVVGI